MVDITLKQTTLRTASGEGFVYFSKATLNLIETDSLPKGNLYDIAKAAAMLAAKNTSNIIPHCHPVSIDHLATVFSHQENSSDACCRVFCQAKSIGRTGIEMEVLTAIAAACLTIYDLLKPVDPELSIRDIKLLSKTGGKSQLAKNLIPQDGKVSFALVTISDSVSSGRGQDKSGPAMIGFLQKYGLILHEHIVVPDDAKAIAESIKKYSETKVPMIFTTGGTGPSSRDVTFEAIEPLLEKRFAGIEEKMRAFGAERNPLAMFSRSLAGIKNESCVIALPGSTNGVLESLHAIMPGLLHILEAIQPGFKHE